MTDFKRRIASLACQLEQGLVERRREVRLVFLTALAGEHSLLIGPPGTAKSALARRLHSAFAQAAYFERLLTRFSVPEELFGPLSISALEQDRYERHTDGFLPQASIAFIDEVFKANSAILNALLTLLNEREFDNGAGRMRCPLISVVGATNEVPEDELAEAFFDRFLIRLTVAPVTDVGFAALLAMQASAPTRMADALDQAALDDLNAAARAVRLPAPVVQLLADLRKAWAEQGEYVSDRRWVKIVHLLRVAAASEGRGEVSLWDGCVLPWCVASTAEGQQAVRQWLTARLGVSGPVSPPRLASVVKAFEAQLEAELQAQELDYDSDGRLRFSAAELASEVGDAKGGAQALRLSHARKRRYGACHIEARCAQLDAVRLRIAACFEEIAALREDFTRYRDQAVWMDTQIAVEISAHLAATAAEIERLDQRLLQARAGFEALPRLPQDDGVVPEAVATEGWCVDGWCADG